MYVSLKYKDEVFFCDVYELILEENYIFLKRNLFSVIFVNFIVILSIVLLVE